MQVRSARVWFLINYYIRYEPPVTGNIFSDNDHILSHSWIFTQHRLNLFKLDAISVDFYLTVNATQKFNVAIS